MAERKPLVLLSGQLAELPDGDTLPSAAIPVSEDYGLITGSASSLDDYGALS